jgi:hypothetical protein
MLGVYECKSGPQDYGYQHSNINPIAQKELIIKSLAGVLDVVQALLTAAK